MLLCFLFLLFFSFGRNRQEAKKWPDWPQYRQESEAGVAQRERVEHPPAVLVPHRQSVDLRTILTMTREVEEAWGGVGGME